MSKEKTYKEYCSICENASYFDSKTLKASTMIINGIKIILCTPCEDDLLLKIAKGRGVNLKLESGEIVECHTQDFICVPIYYSILKRKKLYDTDLIREEFEKQIKKLR